MLLIAAGSATTARNPYGSYGDCDEWLVESYFYQETHKYKAAYNGNGYCFRHNSDKSQQDAIKLAKADCEAKGPYCYLLAVGNTVHGYLNGYAFSKYSGKSIGSNQSNQNYTGNNNICNSSVPGGCSGAFKP